MRVTRGILFLWVNSPGTRAAATHTIDWTRGLSRIYNWNPPLDWWVCCCAYALEFTRIEARCTCKEIYTVDHSVGDRLPSLCEWGQQSYCTHTHLLLALVSYVGESKEHVTSISLALLSENDISCITFSPAAAEAPHVARGFHRNWWNSCSVGLNIHAAHVN